MFFPTSGRMGFDIIKTSNEFPPIETVCEIITYETSIRLSEPIQELMNFYYNDEASLRYHDVNALRTALHHFPDDPAVKLAYYVKHNKITQRLISQGQSRKPFSKITAGQPLVILAGSTSCSPFRASAERINALFRSHAPMGCVSW
ncbi:unnamed protein product [Rotaria magnacalcarata]|uniref:Uncharacterized protein n=1 Tax=Rotaria magnacalcarata TaxID=392030 RepID=A0A8S3AAK9_9BILA|nr:unnamed protein product [Rotaria magnacalcarata]CAF4688254.1 unnamed protein product [Rotaria magnacalcarata]